LAVPVGYSGASAIAMVQLRANEPTYPTPANVLLFLNAGLEQVVAAIGGIRLNAAYPTTPGVNVITLGSDVQDIVSASFSTGSPSAPGALVYPLEQLDQASFMDMAAGFPAAGTGPPQWFFITSDSGTGPDGLLPAPTNPGLSTTPGTSTGYQAYVAQTYLNAAGETVPGPQSQLAVTTANQIVAGSPVPFGNAAHFNTYAGVTPGALYLQNAAPTAIGTSFTLPGTLLTATLAPTVNTASGYASGGEITMQLYPPAMVGQVNTYYRARPQLWADTTTSSTTNLDSMAQEAAILWTVARVLEHRGRSDEAMQIFTPQYQATIAQMKETMNRRVTPKAGTVRDVRSLSYPNGMFFGGRF